MNIQKPIELEKNNDLINDSNNNLKNNDYFINNDLNYAKDEILSIILKDQLNNNKINQVLDFIKKYKLLLNIENTIDIFKNNESISILNDIKNKEKIQKNILKLDKQLDEFNSITDLKYLNNVTNVNNYNHTIVNYYIKKSIVIKELQNKNTLLNIIEYFINLYNLVNSKTNNSNNILLTERQILLFLLVYLTGVDLNILLELRKTDIDQFFDSYKNNLGGLFFISNRKFNKNSGQFELNDNSKFHLIKIKNYLSDYLIQTEDTTNLIDIIYNKFVKETDWYKKRDNTDYIFSTIRDNKKLITKSNAIKDLNDVLDSLKDYKIIDGNSIIKSKLVLDDLFITTNFDNQDLNHFNEFIKLYKLIYKIYILIGTIKDSINEEYKI